jgi:hypothetical protein
VKIRSEPKGIHALKTNDPQLSGASRDEAPFLIDRIWAPPRAPARGQHHGTVEEGLGGAQQCSDNKDGLERTGLMRELSKGRQHAVEHCILEEQVSLA